MDNQKRNRRTRNPGQKTHPEVRQYIESHARQKSAIEIQIDLDRLEREGSAPFDGHIKPKVPSERTIRDICKRAIEADNTSWWSFAEHLSSNGRAAAAAHVFEALRYVNEEVSRERLTGITKEQAKWIIWIREARPSIPIKDAWELAQRYIIAGTDKNRLYHLDVDMAFTPWQSEQDHRALSQAKHRDLTDFFYGLEKTGLATVTRRRRKKQPRD